MSQCYLPLLPFYFAARANSAALGAYPAANLLNSFTYTTANLGILSIQLSSAYRVQTAPAGVVVVVGISAATIDVTNSPNIYLSHVAEINDNGVTVTANSVTSFASFFETGIYLPAGQVISLYGWGNGANNLVAASVVIHTILAK